MLSKSMQDAINEQIKNEFASAYLYLAMSAHFYGANLSGFAHWMREQHQEEIGHAMKFFDYVHDRGGSVAIPGIEKPSANFTSPLDVFQRYLEHERKVTATINKLYELAFKENDYASQIMLHWFVNEQVEEEKVGMDIVEQLKLIGENKTALLMLDRQLGSRGAGR
ncbi:MAG: ferritin [Ignavibacteria bacterium]|nr:ferritin [Ignavibacteria bacterium]